MATKKIGTVLKEARTAAGLTQEQLARRVSGVSAADLGRVERGEADFTQAQLKAIAKVLGVTQASLLNAPKNLTAAAKKTGTTTTAKKTGTSAAKKTGTTTAAKKTGTTAAAAKTPKTPANANSTMKVTATERKLIESYRTATSDQKKAAAKVLKGDADAYVDNINGKDAVSGVVGDVVTGLIGNLFGK